MTDLVAIGQVPGFATGAVRCGIKRAASGREDVGVILCEAPFPAAAVFTTNRMCAPPVRLSRRHLDLSGGLCRGIVVNAGNANCATGPQGEADAAAMAAQLAAKLGGPSEQVLVASTGLIGEPLPMEKIRRGIDQAHELAAAGGGGDFATAILTTDLVTKTASATGTHAGEPFTIAGATKGSGMIAPRMATMLAFVVTDAQVEPQRLQRALAAVNEQTFNRITVDGDTSTNDTVFLLASGKSAAVCDDATEAEFRTALAAVCRDLARKIVRDGEGATHFVTIHVAGAASAEDAARVGRTVAESPLVKTAFAGNDANWGRILAAVGRSGAQVDEATFHLVMNGLELFAGGAPCPAPDPELVKERLGQRDLLVEIGLGQGSAETTFYTCDLTHEYIAINADYHT